MILRLFILITISALAVGFMPLSAFSQDKGTLEATVGVEGRSYNVNGNSAKFYEYKEKTDYGAFGDVNLKYDASKTFLNFQATDPGYNTQHYRLEAGSYGKIKGWLDYNEIIHNTTFGAKTFFQGAGTGTLVGAPNVNSNAWPSYFDYSTKRKRFDTGFNFDWAKPFFFTANYMNERKDGIKATGIATASSADSSLELPEPVNYRTDGINLEAGYSKKPFFLSLSYFYNQFRNGVEDVLFTPQAGWDPTPLSLPPDNKFYRFNLKGNAKLPLNSKFSMSIGDAKATSSAPGFTTFDGKVDTRNYDFALTTNPLKFLEGKIYYKYYVRDNRSYGIAPDTGFTTSPTYYNSEKYGADVGLKLPKKFYLNAGWKYQGTERSVTFWNQPAFNVPALVLPYNTDNTYFADLKWKGLDYMTPRIAYERLQRSADYRTPQSDAALNRQFAYAAQNRDTLKAVVDIAPMEALNLGLEYRLKKTVYDGVTIGLNDDTRNAFSFNADYAFRKLARLYGYFDYERAIMNQAGTVSGSYWDSKQREDTYGYGVRADVYAVPKKLTFITQWDYLRNNGSNDFGFYDNTIFGKIGVPTGAGVNVPNIDSYQKYSLRFTTVYNWSEALMIRGSYAYERYIFSDAQLNGYQYVVASGAGSSGALLTGANANPSYSANVIYLSLAYKFF